MNSNVLLTVEFDGTAYVGWQRQPAYQGVSVQQKIEEALKDILGHPVSIIGAGRTDAGVHALGQRCSFCCDRPVPIARLAEIMNHRLPPDICVREAEEVGEDFHARFSAKSKRYRYLLEREAAPSAFGGRFSWQLPDAPDADIMRQGAKLLVGEHDFRHFTVSGCETKTFTRTVYALEISEPAAPPTLLPMQKLQRPLTVDIEGNGFLYKMVRIITGRLVALGRGQISLAEFAGYLDGAFDRNIPPAPARGLTLMEVKY